MPKAFQNAEWIRLDCKNLPETNLFALFRTRFTVKSGVLPVLLRISVAGNYAAYLNGQTIPAAFGQYTDHPFRKTYSETDITKFCQPGQNELLIQNHFSGNSFTSHFDGEPGLIAEIVQGDQVLASSGSDWECVPDSRYAFGEREKVSSSLNYTFAYDARIVPDTWTAPQLLRNRPVPELRPVPPCVMTGCKDGKIIRSGRLFRSPGEGGIGKIVRGDELDVPEGNGVYALFDLGKEYAGLLTFSITAPEGTVLDIAHGEYLDQENRLPVCLTSGIRHFADRYIARAGEQTFFHALRRLGCRYIEIHAVGDPEKIRIQSAGLYSVEFPGLDTPEFACGSRFWEQAHEVSAETLRLCLHEKYENCPCREQSICMYDARNQMLFGYPFWGNYGHAAAMLRLFGESDSLHGNGLLSIAVPSAAKLNIPSYTFLWFTALYEYTMYSGDSSLFREYAGQVSRMFEKILSWREEKSGLYLPPEMEHLWNYCEAPEMENCPYPPNAFYNLYLKEALESAAKLFTLENEPEKAAELNRIADAVGRTAEPYYYDPETGAYADHITLEGRRGLFHGHIQSLFLAQGLVSPEKRQKIMELLKNETLPFPALGALLYLVKGVFRYGTPEDRRWLTEKLEAHYGRMLNGNSGTWWEVIGGTVYGGGAGSLCHGWSAVPAWFESSVLLGVTPLEPGFRKFLLKPYAGNIPFAKGRIAVPGGEIRVEWQNRKNGALDLTVFCPPDCTPALQCYPEHPVATFLLNGKQITV